MPHSRLLLLLVISVLTLQTALAETAATPGNPAARVIYLVRHGHYDSDPNADPDRGPGISTLGVVQSRLLGARLARLPFAFERRFVSPMQRARDTAATLAGDLGNGRFQVLEDLRECTPTTRRRAQLEGLSEQELADCEAQLEGLYTRHFRPASGQEQHELMVCHGNVIRYLITRSLGVDSEAWLEMSVGHTSITRIRIEADGSFKLVGAGDVGHLPPRLQTGASGDHEIDLQIPALLLESP